MGFWNDFYNHMPYTNLHSINLNWLLQKVKEIPDLVKTEVDRLSQELRGTIADKLSRDGSDSMTGSLDMGGNRIYDLGAPQYPGDAITKAYGDGAYALTGYGLGVTAPITTKNIEELNEKSQNGWFRFSNSTTPISLGGRSYTDAWGNASSYSGSYAVQNIFPFTGQRLQLRRWKYAGEWIDEWVNPPMLANAEYRTIMRHQTSPVYVKRLLYTTDAEIGSADGVATVRINHGIENFKQLVQCLGLIPNSNYQLPYLTTSGGLATAPAVSTSQLTMRFDHNTWPSDTTFEFIIFYTKTEG